jgi:hypothetical protein
MNDTDNRVPTLAEALAFASDPKAVVPAWGRVVAAEVERLQVNAVATQRLLIEWVETLESMADQIPPRDLAYIRRVFKELEDALEGK